MEMRAEFSPDWKVPSPAKTIADILFRKGMSLADLSSSAGLSIGALDEVLAGARRIDSELASKLEKHLGGSERFWIDRDRQYCESLGRESSLSSYLGQVLPLREMVNFGWLAPYRRADSDVSAAIRFFGLKTKEEFAEKYEDLTAALAFRKSEAFDLRIGAFASWMRAVELRACDLKCSKWDKKKLQGSVGEIRALTRERDPSEFLPQLTSICCRAGVALVVVRAPRGCPVSGATTFLSRDKAVIALTFRFLTDDHFWFSLFHEIGHLLLHEAETFLEVPEANATKKELEANDFAAKVIIPAEYQSSVDAIATSKYEIVRFARSLGIAPGLVVGQLQHRGLIKRNQFNYLKRRYRWSTAKSNH